MCVYDSFLHILQLSVALAVVTCLLLSFSGYLLGG